MNTTANLLFIDATVRSHTVSRTWQLCSEYLKTFKNQHPLWNIQHLKLIDMSLQQKTEEQLIQIEQLLAEKKIQEPCFAYARDFAAADRILIGAPYWDSDARGLLIGLTRATNRAHVARAALEGIAFQCAEVLEAMQRDAHVPLTELRVDGGASRNDLLMQFQADISGVPVIRPANTETTALGAAFLAGLACGVWRDLDELSSLWRVDRVFEPSMSADQKTSLMNQWSRAVGRARNWNQ